jgi:hypothetical protein
VKEGSIRLCQAFLARNRKEGRKEENKRRKEGRKEKLGRGGGGMEGKEKTGM